MARRSPVSDAELEVLKVLWAGGPATVRDVSASLRRQRRRLAYNTVLTLLSRLKEKGYVAADRRDTAHLFRAVVTRASRTGCAFAGEAATARSTSAVAAWCRRASERSVSSTASR